MNCAALVELAIPPSLRYIGSRAFLDCTVFRRLAKMPGRHKWGEESMLKRMLSPFVLLCDGHPGCIWHMIPDMGCTPGLG